MARPIAENGRGIFPSFGCSHSAHAHQNPCMVNHPNAGGVLVGLGCENNNLGEFCRVLGDAPDRVKYLNAQDSRTKTEGRSAGRRAAPSRGHLPTHREAPVSRLKLAEMRGATALAVSPPTRWSGGFRTG